MAKVSYFSFMTCLFLYMALSAHPSTSTVNCPPRLCGRKVKPTLTRSGDDIIQGYTSTLESTIASIKSKIPQIKEDDVVTALALCLDHYTDALRTFSSVRDKMRAGENVNWLGMATSVVGDLISCQQGLFNVGRCNANANGVDFSGAGRVFYAMSVIINSPSKIE